MSKTKILILSLIAVIAVGLAGLAVYRSATGNLSVEQKRSHAKIETARKALLQKAKIQADEAVSKRSAEFSEFVNSKKVGAKAFSEHVVSWRGKLVAAKCMLPGTAPDCHKKYVVEKFNEHIFTPDDLKNAMNRSITGGLQDIERIENELAVALRQEILGRSLSPSELPIVTTEFRNAIDAVLKASNRDVVSSAGNLVTSEVVTQIATQVLIRLGASISILATAAASSWWTFGGAMVIGVAVDAIWGYVTQPAKQIESEMVLELDKMSINGSAVIRSELAKVVAARSLLWQKTLKNAIQ